MAGKKQPVAAIPYQRPVIDCTRPHGCDRPMQCNLTCLWRWEHQYQAAAIAYAKRNDLRTAVDHMQHCKELAEGFGKVWGRERMVAHWKKIAANNSAHPVAREAAIQALANLHAEREPGSDDEELAA